MNNKFNNTYNYTIINTNNQNSANFNYFLFVLFLFIFFSFFYCMIDNKSSSSKIINCQERTKQKLEIIDSKV